MKAVMVLPYDNGIQFPGLPEDTQVDFCILSYAPPSSDIAPYVLAEIRAEGADVDTLAGQANCLYLCEVTEEGYSVEPLAPTDRVKIRNKISLLIDGALYGLLNAAIQASQNRSELVFAIAQNAFFRDDNYMYMREQDVRGAGLG